MTETNAYESEVDDQEDQGDQDDQGNRKGQCPNPHCVDLNPTGTVIEDGVCVECGTIVEGMSDFESHVPKFTIAGISVQAILDLQARLSQLQNDEDPAEDHDEKLDDCIAHLRMAWVRQTVPFSLLLA